MKIGVTIRNMGEQSTAEIMAAAVLGAEERGFESAWITDHIAIPPDDAEGSGGRYTDPLTTVAWMAGITKQIKLGTGVLILPYRAKLPTAKQVATVQELSGERLILGVGIGWMDAEFKVLGLDRHQRGRMSDEILEFLQRCFSNEVVEENGQAFLFKPRPPKPPILIGGAAPHALQRAAKYGDGWLPMARSPEAIRAAVAQYQVELEEQGRQGSVSVFTRLPTDEDDAKAQLDDYQAMGVERLVLGVGYQTATEYLQGLDHLSRYL